MPGACLHCLVIVSTNLWFANSELVGRAGHRENCRSRRDSDSENNRFSSRIPEPDANRINLPVEEVLCSITPCDSGGQLRLIALVGHSEAPQLDFTLTGLQLRLGHGVESSTVDQVRMDSPQPQNMSLSQIEHSLCLQETPGPMSLFVKGGFPSAIRIPNEVALAMILQAERERPSRNRAAADFFRSSLVKAGTTEIPAQLDAALKRWQQAPIHNPQIWDCLQQISKLPASSNPHAPLLSAENTAVWQGTWCASSIHSKSSY